MNLSELTEHKITGQSPDGDFSFKLQGIDTGS